MTGAADADIVAKLAGIENLQSLNAGSGIMSRCSASKTDLDFVVGERWFSLEHLAHQ